MTHHAQRASRPSRFSTAAVACGPLPSATATLALLLFLALAALAALPALPAAGAPPGGRGAQRAHVEIVAPANNSVPDSPVVAVKVRYRARAATQLHLYAEGRLLGRASVAPRSKAATHVFQVPLSGFASLPAVQLVARLYEGNPRARRFTDSSPVFLVLDNRLRARRALERASTAPVELQLVDGVARFAAFRVPRTPDVPPEPVAQALAFLERFAGLYLAPERVYLQRSGSDGLGGEHVFFGQQAHGVPVFGAQLGVHLDAQAVTATLGNYQPELPEPPVAADVLHPRAAEDAARLALFERKVVVPQTERIAGRSRLFYYAPALVGEPAGDTRLAWRVMVAGDGVGGGTLWMAFVDALTGELLDVIDQSYTGDRPGEDFDIESVNGAGESSWCWEAPWQTFDDDWLDEDGALADYPGTFPGGDVDGDNAFFFTHDVYHYFFDRFGLRSWDDDEELVEEILEVSFRGGPNASYSPGCDHLRFSRGWVTLDVLTHEFTHAITQWSSGLVYQNQSGALNESYSDVFGVLVDDDDFLLGEDLGGGALRDLSDPTVFGDPDHMSLFCSSDATCTFTGDSGGVHTNSGIPNKAAYLLIAGDTHKGIRVDGLGRRKVEQLYLNVLRWFLPTGAQFVDARNATLQRARDFVDLGLFGFTAADVCDVANAFAAVGIGPADRDCDGSLDDVDADDDGDGVADVADNCPTVFNPRQEDSDGDGSGDVCDLDRDGDGLANGLDNCPLVANPDQLDRDGDGIGEACDDDDGDGVPNLVDNCRTRSNRDQSDVDGDGLGDVCDADADGDGWLNATDSCPLLATSVQADGDRDGVGDACDNCPAMANADQSDVDGDGDGDACDADDDGDGVADEVDNCSGVANADQLDVDGNGLGLACDPEEVLVLSGIGGGALEGLIEIRDAGEPLRIPFFPCVLDGCPDWLGEGFRTEVSVELGREGIAMPARVVSDEAASFAKQESGESRMLSFRPEADTFFRSPLTRQTFAGSSYVLELLPAPGMQEGQRIPLRITVKSGG